MLEQLVALIPDQVDYFLLMFARFSGFFTASGTFSRRNIPLQARIGLAGALALLALYAFPPSGALAYSHLLAYALMLTKELLLGMIIGYVMNMFFNVIAYVGGHLIDIQMGFGMVNVYDVASNATVSVTGTLLNQLIGTAFSLAGGNTKVFYLLHVTFDFLPVGEVTLAPGIAAAIVAMLAQTFLLAMHVTMPFIACGLLFEFSMGILIRTVPQMHMFVVGIPAKILLGLLLLVVVIPVYVRFTDQIFTEMFYGIENLLGLMA